MIKIVSSLLNRHSFSRRFFEISAAIFLSSVITSCSTMDDYNYKNINKNLSSQDYEAVYSELEQPEQVLYKRTDKALEALDKGLICHYSGNYEKSNELLTTSENLMDKYSAVSVSQQLGSLITNDNVIDYSGDPFEDIYISVFKALNYLKMNQNDDAFVEVRRVNTKLTEISLKYRQLIEKSRRELKENSQSIPDKHMTFHNSALARYISMLMYRSENNYDDAYIDQKAISEAFRLQKSIYNFSIPSTVREELTVSKNQARLNVLAFTGLCPIKKEIRLPLFAVDGFYKVCLPELIARKSEINGVRIKAINSETGESYDSYLQELENIENISIDTFSDKYNYIVAKTIGRMVFKLTSTVLLDAASKKAGKSDLGLVLSLISLASKANMFLSERADVRISRYFPAVSWVTGITVPEGNYNIYVEFLRNNNPISVIYYKDVAVKNGGMNLVESCCLR